MSALARTSAPVDRDLLDRVLAPQPPPFALLHRPDSGSPDAIDVLVGNISLPASLTDVPPGVTAIRHASPGHDVLLVVPYRQIAERGFAAPDDGAPLIAMTITEQQQARVADVFARIPDVASAVTGSHFDSDDDHYAEIVRRIVTDEIGTGEGANFVIKRSFVADIRDYYPQRALAFFCRLLEREHGSYWTFIIHTGGLTFVGASPERHVTLSGGRAVMNPISGTYRYPSNGPTLQGINQFLADRKEAEELYMVVDEELKMMARICESGGRVIGPYLKEMAQLAHTEYFIEGHTTREAREILMETMFAPTVTGSPVESASRVIDRYEPEGRGYYSGIAALIGHDASGGQTLDSAIMIRTAAIDRTGRMRIGVGATLVRHSDPTSEVKETAAKAAGLLSALKGRRSRSFRNHPEVRAALKRRNTGIADFWLRRGEPNGVASAPFPGLNALVIDAEDNFTAMIDHQLRSLGPKVTVRRFDEPYELGDHGLVVMGPGPGDPRAADDPKIAQLRSAVDDLLVSRHPFVAVCLSHQVLCLRLGMELVRRPVPNQGVQREIDLFGEWKRVGFYNTFAAYCAGDMLDVEGVGMVEVSRDRETHEVHALRGPFFTSMQFHAESLLTVDGPLIVADAVRGALGR
jgi:2-amino-4-deoxychorismate synthase